MSTIYIHWPFCLSKCHYCDFNSVPIKGSIDFAFWLSLYKLGLLNFLNQFYNNERITSIYFGGGTPSLLPTSFVSSLLSTIYNRCNISENAEITLEANPKTINLWKAKELKSAGINRLSIGVQSIIEDDLRILGRKHSACEAVNCVFEMSRVFSTVSVDLIYNRPGQRLEDWIDELNVALSSLPIQHVSLYELIVENGTLIKKMIDEGILPSPSRESEFIKTTWMIAESCGFHKYEISNFAKPGFEGRHNLSYWKYDDFYGIGPGAHSRISRANGRRIALEQASIIDDWINFIKSDLSFEMTELNEEEEFKERLIMGLRAKIGVDLSVSRIDNKKIQFLLENSYIMLKEGRVILTDEGLLRLNLVVKYLSGK
ncbi:MAG: radical SAM family heme chaperone HemW [Holosporales bacterium]|jgi:oxygen-independent coproporphyrinogen-3 oxidase|nr:radical SAM family heme chaperone HemW [Holosporales bacterium]